MNKLFLLLAVIVAGLLNAPKAAAQSDELVNVYRWYNSADNNYVTVSEDEYQEGQLLNWKWKDKQMIFTAYRNPGPNRVAINSWFNPVTKDYASIAEDEFTDDQMIKMGYTQKKLQFYAPTRRGPNTVAVYRWRHNGDWITIADDSDTDVYLKKNYRHKVFQYFGIVRDTDVLIYNQL